MLSSLQREKSLLLTIQWQKFDPTVGFKIAVKRRALLNSGCGVLFLNFYGFFLTHRLPEKIPHHLLATH
jgi:hypothetical protein